MPADVLAGRLPASRDLLGVTMTELTEAQCAAIDRRDRDVLLDAGAGSGKTTVLVERFARAVLDDGVDASRILAITFTEKAAAELRERVRVRLRSAGDPAGDAAAVAASEDGWISTIHGFCARVLRENALDAQLDPGFTVLEASAAGELQRAAFDEALADVARTDAGSELIAVNGVFALRAAVLGAYGELRSRGQAVPRLPTVAPPGSGEASDEQLLAEFVCAANAAARELGAVPSPGPTIIRAIDTLAVAAELSTAELPWAGALDDYDLRRGAGALKTELCERYRSAHAALIERSATRVAIRQAAALDALLAAFGDRYATAKRDRGAVDFDDLETRALALLRRPEIGDRYRERFAHVMVDELQDTNRVQWQLIDCLAGGGHPAVLFMVGDAQQSIYAFRHAEVELFEARGRRLAEHGDRLALQENFRTRPEILAAINAGFTTVIGEDFRPLLPGRTGPPATGPLVDLMIVDKGAEWPDGDMSLAAPWRIVEARHLADRIASLIDTGKATAGEIVILTRAATDLHVYERALEREGIPTFVVGGRGYWLSPQVIDLLAYLRAIANPLDAEALYTVYSSALCGLSLSGLVLTAAGAHDELTAADAAALAGFEPWFAAQRAAMMRRGPERLLTDAIAHAGYDRAVLALPGGTRRWANVRKLLRLAREWEDEHGPDLHGFVAFLVRRAAGGPGGERDGEAPVEAESVDAVRLMTIHRSKGLEFPVVCVADLGRGPHYSTPLLRTGRLPGTSRDDLALGLRVGEPGTTKRIEALAYKALKETAATADVAEQRRLFYVAMTRAQDRLILSGATKLAKFGDLKATPMDWIGPAFGDLPGVRTTRIEPDGSGAASESASGSALGSRSAPGAGSVSPGGGTRRDAAAPRLAADAPPPQRLELTPAPAISSVSYSSLVAHRRCGYRFYLERVVGLPAVPSASSGAVERGVAVHELLRDYDYRARGLPSGVAAADHAALVDALRDSPIVARLSAVRDVRREQSFAFLHDGLLVNGAFDILAGEGAGDLIVVDYKTDALHGRTPEAIVTADYWLQQLIYGIAALGTGAPSVDVVHVFLDAADRPVSRRFAAADEAWMRAKLDEASAGLRRGAFPVSAEPRRSLCTGCPAAGGLCPWPVAMTQRPTVEQLF